MPCPLLLKGGHKMAWNKKVTGVKIPGWVWAGQNRNAAHYNKKGRPVRYGKRLNRYESKIWRGR